MRPRVAGFSIVLFFFVTVFSFAGPSVRERVTEAYRYTAKVVVKNGDPFSGSVQQGHGTGFIVELTETEGILFTNRHVVTRQPWQAQKLELEFRDGQRGSATREAIPAEILYKSGLFDLAVLKFRRADLSPTLNSQLDAAKLPDASEYTRLSVSGSPIVVVGNPLDTEAVVTDGIITNQEHRMPWHGIFLQISAPINPGNSGGPLIDLETGKVLGICTLKRTDGEGMGFALPMIDALAEYNYLKQAPDSGARKHLPFILQPVQMAQVKAAGFEPILNDVYPQERIFHTNEYLHFVVASGTPLILPQDLILSAEGQFVGGCPFLLRRIAQHSSKQVLSLEVLRRGKVVKVEVPLISEKQNGNGFEFVSFSGALFTDLKPFEALTVGSPEGGVRLFGSFPGTLSCSLLQQTGGAILAAVEYKGDRVRINSTAELKAYLRRIPAQNHAEKVTLHFVAPMQAQLGHAVAVLPGQNHDRLIPVIVPLAFLIDDEMLNFPQVLRDFDFTGFERPETRMGLVGLYSCARQVLQN